MVVIDVGLADPIEVWTSVISRLAAQTCVRTNAPDTARAMAGRIRRTAHAVVGDLRLLLQKLSLPTPYVLVGHSLGAVHMMLLAAESPELAGAMLLLDPPPHGFISGERFPRAVEDGGSANCGVTADGEGGHRTERSRQGSVPGNSRLGT